MTPIRKLTLVIGGGSGSAIAHTPTITVAPEPKEPSGALQLTIPVLTHRAATLVSVGSEGLDLGDFANLLTSSHVATIVDVRTSPSFQSLRCSSTEFFRLLAGCQVSYRHAPELSNPFIAETWADDLALRRYAEHIGNTAKVHLLRLRQQITQGPLLLLGRGRRHEGSERQCIVDQLATIDTDFDLSIVDSAYPDRTELR